MVYGSALVLTFGGILSWMLFRDEIEDLIYGSSLFSFFKIPVSFGDVSSVALWTVAYYFASPIQLLFVFLGRFEKERPSDWILRRLTELLNQPVEEPSLGVYAATYVWIFGIALLTTAALKTAFEDSTWGVSTGIGACMAAGVFEISRPRRLSTTEKELLRTQFTDFVGFADQRLKRSGGCHESEVFKAFRTEVQGYRDTETLTDIALRQFVKEWSPTTVRTGNGFFKGLSIKPRPSAF